MARKGGLGKGIDVVFEENAYNNTDTIEAVSSSVVLNGIEKGDRILQVPENLLQPNPYQPRREFSEESLQELADSIKEHGVIEPVIVTENKEGGYYIVGGERRTRAARLAGLKEIPVCIKTYTNEKMLEVALIENIQREDLNALEEAKAYQQLMQMSNLSQEDVAKRVGKKRSTVANSLRLLKLPEDMQSALISGTISAGHARALLSILSAQDQRVLFAKILGTAMSVRQAEQMANEINGNVNISKKTNDKKTVEVKRDADLVSCEQKMIELLGTKVSIKGNLERGNIQIEYFSSEDLNRIYSLISKE